MGIKNYLINGGRASTGIKIYKLRFKLNAFSYHLLRYVTPKDIRYAEKQSAQ